MTEYGGKARVKLAPRPVTLVVTGATFAGSWMELVTSGLSVLRTTAWPSGLRPDAPLISTFYND